MDALCVGVCAFLLYIFYDVNSVLWRWPLLRGCFAAGCALLLAATGLDVYRALPAVNLLRPGPLMCLVMAAASLILLVYTLFFALPFQETYRQETYRQETEERRVCDQGMYALCRHPGVWWLFTLYLFLGLALTPSPLLRHGMVYSICDLVYVIVQDLWTFPRTFSDYGSYQKMTPFLLPTPASVRRALGGGVRRN